MSLPKIGASLVLDGEKEYKRAITDINNVHKTLISELDKLTAEFEDNAKSGEFLAQKMGVLNKQLEAHKTKVDYVRAALNKATERYEKSSKEVERFRVQLDNAKKALEQMKSRTASSTDEISQQQKKIADLEKSLQGAEAAMRTADNQTETWRQSLNRAEISLAKTEKALKDTAKSANLVAQTSKKLESLGGNLSKIGGKLTPVTYTLIGLGTAAVKMGSDFVESSNKVEVAFGSSSSTIKRWSESALESYGIAQGTALDMAALFGDMATSMDISQSEAAEMSKTLVGLAGDLASFKNVGFDQVQNALKSIFTGETESLKELGIVMTQTNLDAYAMSKGIGKATSEMTEAEKVQLRYQYVLSKTGNAQGDFKRTSDGTANSTRVFTESIKELGSTVGRNLLPKVTPIIQGATDIIEKFSQLDEETQDLIIRGGLLLAATGPILVAGGKILTGGSEVVKTIGSITSAVSGLAGKLPSVKIAADAGSSSFSGLGSSLLGGAGAIFGVASLTTAVIAMVSQHQDAHDEVLLLTDELDRQKQSLDDLNKTTLENASSNAAEVESTRMLFERLRELTDQSGHLIGDKEELKQITDEINSIMPDTVHWIDEERIAYKGMSNSIDSLIEKKKAKAVLDALEPQYQEAILRYQENMNKKAEAYNLLVNEQRRLQELKTKAVTTADWMEVKSQEEKVAKAKEAYGEISGIVAGQQEVIGTYENGAKALSSNNIKEVKRFNSEYLSSVTQTTAANKEELLKQIETTRTAYALMAEDVKNKLPGASRDMLRQMGSQLEEMESTFQKMAGMPSSAFAQAMTQEQPKAEFSIRQFVDGIFRTGEEGFKSISLLPQMAANDMQKNMGALEKAAGTLPASMGEIGKNAAGALTSGIEQSTPQRPKARRTWRRRSWTD